MSQIIREENENINQNTSPLSTLHITNERIIEFYRKYSSLHFEEVNLMFVDLFERLLNNASGVIDNSILENMLQKMQQTATNTDNALQQIQNMKEVTQLSAEKASSDITTIQTILKQITQNAQESNQHLKTDITNGILTQLHEKEFSDESMGKITALLESQLNGYIDKTKLFYVEKLPDIIDTTNKPLLQTLSASEERLTSSLSEIKEKSIIQGENTAELKQSLHDHILSSKTSSRKGDISENKLLPILSQIFPSDEVVHNGSGKQAHCCDYTVIRNTGKNILVENKDYAVNIGPDNIKKFIDDIERNNAHGIFLSQNSGISGKENYKIDIHKNNVLVYLHNVNYEPGKIKAAIEIIDQLSERLNEIDLDENSISKDDLDTINIEFNNMMEAKENMIRLVNDFQKRMVTSIKQLNLTCLEKYLNTKFAHMKAFDFVCEFCNKGWDTRRALAAHRKGCQKKHAESKAEVCEIVVDTED